MKQNNYFYFLLFILLTLASCIGDNDNNIIDLPEIKIDNLSAAIPAEIFFGDTLRLNPNAKYGESDQDVLQFKWYKQLSNELVLLSEEPTLSYVMDQLGFLTIRLEVIHKETGVMTSSTINTSVISRSERGWYIFKETPDGNSDLDLFRITSSGEYDGSFFNLLGSRSSALKGKPADLSFTYNFRWKDPNIGYFNNYIPTLLLVSEEDIAAFRISDELVLERGENMFFDQQDGLSLSFEKLISTPSQIILTKSNRQVHIMQQGMQAFLPKVGGDYQLSKHWTISSSSMSMALAFDEKNESFVYIPELASQLVNFPDIFLNERHSISPNRMGGEISFMENTDGSLNDSIPNYSQRAYALFHENGRTDRCVIMGLDLAQVDPIESVFGSGKYSPIMYADTLYYTDYPELATATSLALHKNYPILYIANSNKISSLNINTKGNKIKKDIINYPAGETISFIHYIDCAYDGYDNIFHELVVATYTDTGKYSIYRYRIAGDDIHLVDEPFEGEGKVKSIIFASPNSQSWQNSMYRYY